MPVAILEPPPLSVSPVPSPIKRSVAWRPASGWVFYGQGPLYLGIEIEVTDHGPGEPVTLRHLGCNGELGWIKRDMSVYGFEINTHPMSYEWAMEHFPWQMLPDLKNAGCSIITRSNGIHVHVSADGFTGPAHTYRWLRFFYRNKQSITVLARRNPSYWAPFSATHAQHYRNLAVASIRARLAQAGVPARERRRLVAKRNDLIRGGTGGCGAIRVNDEHGTHEVRVFASTLRPERAQAALGLVHSTIMYTAQLTAHEVINGGWYWGPYRAWVARQGELYAPLLGEMTRLGV